MKQLKRMLFATVLLTLMAGLSGAQTVSTFEMRYLTSDPKANGETDFHGETEWMCQDQRIDFLNKYASFASRFWGNPELDEPLLGDTEAAEALSRIKAQPLTSIRRTLRLDGWRAYGHKEGKAEETRKRWNEWTSAPGSAIANGRLMINGGTVRYHVGKMDWRFRFKGIIEKSPSCCTIAFQGTGATLFSVSLTEKGIETLSGGSRRNAVVPRADATQLELYADLDARCFFVSVNGKEVSACPIEANTASSVDCLAISAQGEASVEELSLYSFVKDFDNKHTPFYTDLKLNEDFEEVLPIDRWQAASYDDSRWQVVNLPSVHGGLAEAGEDYYLRKKVQVGQFGRALLRLETLDPGGEVWVNGQVVGVINNRHPYVLDVTDYLKSDSENLIAVRVKPYVAGNTMLHSPSDKHIGWQLGRTELLLTGRCMIKDAFVHTTSIADGKAVQTNRLVLHHSGVYSRKGSVEVNYYPWFPEEGGLTATSKQKVELRPAVDNEVVIDLPITGARLWETDSPALYKVEVILRNEKGEAIDDYVTTTGIRTIEQKNGTLYVNHKAEMLNGAQIMGNRYPIETIAKTSRCVPAETVVQDLLMIKKMNGNMLRVHVHAEKDTIDGINDPRYAEYADQLGVYLLWQTAGWIREGEAWNVDFEGYPKYMKQVYNHPSIVMWEASNHPNRFKRHGTDDTNDYMGRVYHAIARTDTSRLISPTSFWQHTHYGMYDGTKDYKGNPMAPNPVIMEKRMTRGSQDAYTGYGADWSYLRKAPHKWAASCLNANDKCYFNFEHEESAAQPNWELVKREPWYRVQSYEWGYEEGSIGRRLDAEEWRASQAFQAFAAWESMKKQTLLGYDGFSWCSLESGANMFTYQKPLVDAVGVPKLAYYANKQAFHRTWAASDNVDVVYGPDDSVTPVVFNLGEGYVATLTVELKNEQGKTVERKRMKHVQVPQGRSATRLKPFRFKARREGCHFIVYTLRVEN